MAESFDYCVVGNGLLGASAAEHLARKGFSVCVIGATYGTDGLYYSSHEDASRIYRGWHGNEYWRNLSIANFAAIRALEAETAIDILDAVPVYYDHYSPDFVSSKQASPYLTANGFAYEDDLGGVINPKRYIEALNMAAQRRGAAVFSGVVNQIAAKSDGFDIDWTGGRVSSRKVVDVRGIHGDRSSGLKIQAKVLCFAMHPSISHKHCFLKRNTEVDVFADFYACAEYGQVDEFAVSKFGFSEAEPLYLETPEALSAWFKEDFLKYPHIAEANALIQSAGYHDILDLTLQPCAFTTTQDSMPLVEERDNYLSVAGCNGMAAKCCQVLMSSLIDERGF